MLQNMFIGDPPGNTDRILDFSTAVTGTLFFVPAADFLDDLPDPPAPGATAAPVPACDGTGPRSAPAAPDVLPDGSLGVGSLKRSIPS
jgi:putative iron-dependent peroxidase